MQERHRYHAVVILQVKFPDCYLFNSSKDPNLIPLDEFIYYFQNTDGLILYNGELYYFDHKTQEIKLKEKQQELIQLIAELKPDTQRLASYKELSLINAITHKFDSEHSVSKNSSSNIVRRALSAIKLKWEKQFEPKCYINSNEAKTKFYFAGEIPEAIFNEKDDKKRAELLKLWASNELKIHYGYDESQLEYRVSSKHPEKDKLQATVFELDMQICQKPLINLVGGYFAQVGDARRTPNYFVGHGLNDAIAGGRAFVSALPTAINSSFQKEKFLEALDTMDLYVEKQMKPKEVVEYKKLLQAFDKLIQHLEKKPLEHGKEALTLIYWAKDELQKSNNFVKILSIVDLIKPIIDAHKHRDINLGYQLFRFIASIFSKSANKTKSANFFENVQIEIGDAISKKS